MNKYNKHYSKSDTKKIKEKLVELYKQMSDITYSLCKNEECWRVLKHSCCNLMYCLSTIDYAKNEWWIVLKKTQNSLLPLLWDNWCTAAPHLRPSCTKHVCCINKFWSKPWDNQWTQKYFTIRQEIDKLEVKLFKKTFRQKQNINFSFKKLRIFLNFLSKK